MAPTPNVPDADADADAAAVQSQKKLAAMAAELVTEDEV